MHKLCCVLLIDDDSTSNYLHKFLICDLQISHQVHCCTSGKQALAFLEQCVQNHSFPELIFIDRKMPLMDGFEFLKIYMEREYHKKYVSIITMLTAYINSADLTYLSHLGFVKYMPKPLTEKELLEVVHAHNNRQSC
ncbi:response regulator [Rhodocytophaga aerolata]|uniref:Response regulator n=1 Tax=Rhodocytophaga aerolata TaxID=455078 RepID=A0ABT8RIJ5_9BACT|nr:response regulator [Rhodocytophaga aerolata]MDO1451526.1 response regulator [Rhodocytophaga aerolata]